MLNQEESFKRIYDQYQNMVLHTAYQYLQNQEDAEEITQDVFVQVYHSYAKFEGKSSLKTWIYRICINKSLDYIKYKTVKKEDLFLVQNQCSLLIMPRLWNLI
ncbi:MAG: RNA polymerase sigma factor [Flavobacterium sp.]